MIKILDYYNSNVPMFLRAYFLPQLSAWGLNVSMEHHAAVETLEELLEQAADEYYGHKKHDYKRKITA